VAACRWIQVPSADPELSNHLTPFDPEIAPGWFVARRDDPAAVERLLHGFPCTCGADPCRVATLSVRANGTLVGAGQGKLPAFAIAGFEQVLQLDASAIGPGLVLRVHVDSDKPRCLWCEVEAHDDERVATTVQVSSLSQLRDRPDVDVAAVLDRVDVVMYHLDRAFRIDWVNEPFTRMFGPGDLRGGSMLDHLHADDADRIVAAMIGALTGESPYVRLRCRLANAKRDTWVDNIITLERDDEGILCGVTGVLLDVTREVIAASLVDEADQRLQVLADNAPIAVFEVDECARVHSMSSAWHAFTGQPPIEALGWGWQRAVLPEDLDRLRTMYLASGRVDGGVVDVRSTLTGAWIRMCTNRVAAPDGTVIGFIGTAHDVTLEKAVSSRLQHMATHDDVTGLLNRRGFAERIDARADTTRAGALILIDLDRFKIVNDLHGHAVGDQLLVEVANRLTTLVRGDDIVARFGGDEFVVYIDDAREHRVRLMATRILSHLRAPIEIGERTFQVAASAGVALRDSFTDIGPLLADADVAMFAAKREEPGSFVVFDAAREAAARRRLELDHALTGVVGRGELQVAYQPIFDSTTGAVAGAEALARWHHPVLGSVSPVEFIPLAEENGQVGEIGRHVFTAAAALAAELWAEGWAGRMWVNVSAVQLADPSLAPGLLQILSSLRCPTSAIGIEVTETALLRDMDVAVDQLNGLAASGVGLAIDDFGTGYGALTYLRRLPVTHVKVDRSFVDEIDDPGTASMVRSVIGLAHDLKIEVVGEGVETEAQLATLRRMGCDLVSGYLLARPDTPDRLAAAVAAARASI
jgi:diguanylate cyclase (GGDEF)-like protein/PAS domain S-box-containing protein